jgi:hypothetical protein
MAMDFPTSPALNQTYTYAGITYTWNGYGWIGGALGSAGVIGDAPSDGNEYVRVNGIWRLKEQSFDVSGKASQEVAVPANAKLCQIVGIVYPSSAAPSSQASCRISHDGTTFLTGASDYNMAGAAHGVGSAGFFNIATYTANAFALSGNIDVANTPNNFTTELGLQRPSTSHNFSQKSFSTNYVTAATHTYMHWWHNGYISVGSGLAIKALQFFMAVPFGANSSINIRWVY